MPTLFSHQASSAGDARRAHDALLPRTPGGMGAGALLALLAHGVLIVALTSTVQWRTRTPEVFSAELWAAVPQAAAPQAAAPTAVVPPPAPPPIRTPAPAPAPAPPSPTRDADIVTEQARKAEALRQEQDKLREQEAAKVKAELDKAKAKAKAEADAKKAEAAGKKAEALKAEKAEAARRKKEAEEQRKAAAEAKADDEKLAKQREENLRRMMGQAGSTGPGATPAGATGTGGSGTAAQGGAPTAAYVGRLIALIKPNIVFTGQAESNASAEVEVRAAAGGSILSRRLVKSSGNKDWDDAVLRAIDRTAALPRDTDGRVPQALTLVFRPGG